MRRMRRNCLGDQGYNVLNSPAKSTESTALSRAVLSATNDDLTPAPHVEAVIEKLLSKLRIAVVFGGNKSQDGAVIYPTFNTRSWKSYESVANDIARALRRIGFKHVDLLADDMHVGDR